MSQKSVPIIGAVIEVFAVGAVIGWFCADASSTRSASATPQQSESKSKARAAVPSALGNSSRNNDREFGDRLEKILATRNQLKRARAIAAIADGLNPQQIREALEAIQKVYISEQQSIMMKLFSRWGELEPEIAFAYVQDLADTHRTGAIIEVTKSWARKDLEAARSRIAKMPESPFQRGAVGGLIEALSETDPAQAFALAKQNETYSNVVGTLFTNWAGRDPREAAAHAVQFPRGFQRDFAISVTAREWAKTDLPGALAWAESLPDEDASGNSPYNSPASAIFLTWADEDADGALRWLEDMPAGARKNGFLDKISSQIGRQTDDPRLFERVVSIVPSERRRQHAWGEFIEWWWYQDRSAALEWARKQPRDIQEATIPRLAGNMSSENPAAALELTTALNGKARDEATVNVLSGWASQDPVAAGKWAQEQPPNATYLRGVALAWVTKDLAGATEWVNTLEAGPAKDQMLNDVVRNVQERNPRIAVAWIEGIADDGKREAAYKDLSKIWLRNDPAAASAWIESGPVSEAFKQTMLQGLKK